jgi:signal transduction histidine kinase
MPRWPAPAGFTIRAVSVAGFVLTIAIWSFTGYRFAQHVTDVRREAAGLDERYVRAQELLSGVRTQVLLGSVYVRDALIDPEPTPDDDYRHRIEATFRAVDSALQEYEPILDSPAELQRIERLRREIGSFRDAMLDIVATEKSARPSNPLPLLQGRVVPGRDVVLDVSDQVQRLNRSAYVRQQATVADVFATADRQMWRQLGIALAINVAIGLLAFSQVGRLERRLQRQHVRDVEQARALHLLSARLIHAQEEQRRNVARELHDQLGQELTALRLNLNALKARSAENQCVQEQIEKLETIAQRLDQDLDFLVWELRPTVLDDFGLRAALARHTEDWSKMNGVRAELHSTGLNGDRLPPEVETTLFRAAQEALNNVAKHARASRVDVILERRLNQVALIVEDDGIGFDPSDESAVEQRVGLAGMRERAALVGGTVHVESAPGKGTTVFVRAPIATNPESVT